jgi:uncharacterized membrane protein YukC
MNEKIQPPIDYIIANNLNFGKGWEHQLNIVCNYNLNVFYMLGIMLILVAIALLMPFIFIYQLVKKWEKE